MFFVNLGSFWVLCGSCDFDPVNENEDEISVEEMY